jgi:hypothetical protein
LLSYSWVESVPDVFSFWRRLVWILARVPLLVTVVGGRGDLRRFIPIRVAGNLPGLVGFVGSVRASALAAATLLDLFSFPLTENVFDAPFFWRRMSVVMDLG